jgi:ATP-binding cassette subfamily C (CFTR/MRP) protein 1
MDLGYVVYFTFNVVTSTIGTLLIVSFATPPTIVIILFVEILYLLIQRYYRVAYREMKRVESLSRSPVYSHFSACINGTSVIRAFGMSEHFLKENQEKINVNSRAWWLIILINRWISFHLESLSSLIVFFASLFTILFRSWFNPILLALSVTYSLKICDNLNTLIRYYVEVEAGFVSAERIDQ